MFSMESFLMIFAYWLVKHREIMKWKLSWSEMEAYVLLPAHQQRRANNIEAPKALDKSLRE